MQYPIERLHRVSVGQLKGNRYLAVEMKLTDPLTAFALIGCSPLGSAQQKPVVWNNDDVQPHDGVTHHSFLSLSMDREVGYSLYLPPNYSLTGRRYSVVYFSHGACGNENSDGPGFSKIAGRLAESGTLQPVICVFPNGGMSGYRDHPESKITVETMITKELIPLIDSTYRTLRGRESRAIAGFSMGGSGAIRLALLHPDLFSVAGSWAGAFGPSHNSALADQLPPGTLANPSVRTRLLLVAGYEDEATYASHGPFIKALTHAKYPYTFHTLADVPHDLDIYYRLTGDEMARFLIADLSDHEPSLD